MRRLNPRRIDGALLLPLAVASLWALISSVRAADYHVDPADEAAYATVQAAVDAVSGQSEFDRANIFIAPGTYNEIVVIEKPYVSLIGTGDTPNATRIIFSRAFGLDWNPVVDVEPDAFAFMARNITFENSLPDQTDIAGLALRIVADRTIFDNVRVLGYQDTLLADASTRQYFRDCFITGDVDFIFGNATAVFDHCTIESAHFGWVTAADTERTTANGFVFLDCTLTARGTALTGTVFLGRPWRWNEPQIDSSVIFIRTQMGRHIAAAGWDPWNLPGQLDFVPDSHSRFSEFGSMDSAGNPLADSDSNGTPNGRVFWADPMTAEQAANYTLENIFGPVEFWSETTQPETSGAIYESQGDPWNPLGQLALLPTEPGPPAQALNISTRLRAQTGDNVIIAGFILTGADPRQLLLRAIGPSLERADIDDPLQDPVLELHAADGTRIAFNNSWRFSQEAAIIATGIAPSDDREAAILATLAPGSYTAIIRGRHATSGVAVAEVYDLGASGMGQLANISTRGFIDRDEDVMIAGFILAGGSGTSKVIVRGIGPSLAAAGIEQPLVDPTLALHDGNGVEIAFNDNWQDSQRAEIDATGLAPANEREAAIVASLPPGAYTAVLSGGSGVGLVEVYQIGF